jgi:Pyridine nucleotide-disulphide oxidoreductase
MRDKNKRIAIIGGGPIGVEAALYGVRAGFNVQLYERGRLAENVRQWGYIRVFTEWGRNRSPLACRLLQEAGGALPPGEETSTGNELADYVVRVAALEPLRGRIHQQTEVTTLARERCLKSDFIGDPRRTAFPFRLLLRGPFGERIKHADAVLDTTGVYATPNWMGSGGAACAGELECRRRIDYHLPDVAGFDRRRFANHHSLVIGSGHSAASTLRAIAELIPQYPRTRVTWAVRRDVPEHGYPYTLVEDDPSPHRDELHRRANELTEHPNVDFWPRTVVEAVAYRNNRFRVALNDGAANSDPESTQNLTLAAHDSWLECDNVVVHTGFRPDRSLWSELQVLEHPATGGPFHLAEALIANNARSGVGLSTGYAERRAPQEDAASEQETAPAPAEHATAPDRWHFSPNDPVLLQSGEPDFYILGIKSYGRDAGFLMQNGFRQVRDVYKLISGDDTLDLYEGALS